MKGKMLFKKGEGDIDKAGKEGFELDRDVEQFINEWKWPAKHKFLFYLTDFIKNSVSTTEIAETHFKKWASEEGLERFLDDLEKNPFTKNVLEVIEDSLGSEFYFEIKNIKKIRELLEKGMGMINDIIENNISKEFIFKTEKKKNFESIYGSLVWFYNRIDEKKKKIMFLDYFNFNLHLNNIRTKASSLYRCFEAKEMQEINSIKKLINQLSEEEQQKIAVHYFDFENYIINSDLGEIRRIFDIIIKYISSQGLLYVANYIIENIDGKERGELFKHLINGINTLKDYSYTKKLLENVRNKIEE